MSLLSLSLMQEQGCTKIRNKRQRAEGVEILEHSRSNNWSKNSHFLYEGRREENEASVSASFYLLNLCLFSIWDNMVIQVSLSNQLAQLPSQTSPVKGLNSSTDALPPAAALLVTLVLVHTHNRPRCHRDAETGGLTWAHTMGLADGIFEQRMKPSSTGAKQRAP